MLEYSQSLSDALRHKIRAFALQQSKIEQHRARCFQEDAAKAITKAKRNRTLTKEMRKEL